MAGKKEDQIDDKNVEAFLRNHGSLTPKRYAYVDIKKMTNSFADKLGEGGYGSVFKGKLPDGRLVAVKVLNDANGDGLDFVNEVSSISRTSHVNIVTLLGFCLERTKRALVYEFMPNKSLDKFIRTNGSSSLDCETLYRIAVGTARGLEYLHQGCNTRIVHFDIKPENILLDEEFCPKISDFGLAKLCQRKKSIVSMLGARGTPGYIAPEVFCRNFGEVSHKSDVYSYGMMVINMVGAGKKAEVGSNLDSASEMYFVDIIYKHLELGENSSLLQGVKSEDIEETRRKMVMVSLWCIQTYPSDRPSMSQVLEMLEGSIESIEVAPKPFFPMRVNLDSFSALSGSSCGASTLREGK
ncbi:hypothetical protein LguiB_033197 [Lonicera macranthoides]